MVFLVAALYQFKFVSSPNELKSKLFIICSQFEIIGALIIANEGINGTIAAANEENMKIFMDSLITECLFDNLEIKYSTSDSQPFYRMRLCVKDEIVTMGIDRTNGSNLQRGLNISPKEWNQIITNEETILIDTRNEYEVNLGSFEGAINPHMKTFRDFPSFVSNNLNIDKDKPIAMFCTGGIRCEKASAYLYQNGFKNVYNLHGGILKYLEEVDEKNSLWHGECFVFDQRVSVKHKLEKGNAVLCRHCRHPLLESNIQNEKYEQGITCEFCYDEVKNNPKKLESLQERNNQMNLAVKNNVVHIGYKHPKHELQKMKNIVVDKSNVTTSD